MIHNIKYYEDGFKLIEFCCKCGAEGVDLRLTPACLYIEPTPCVNCGHIECKCDQIRKEMKKAIDTTNSRN